MTTNRVKLSTGTYKELFIALRRNMQDLKHRVVKDQNRRSVPIMNLVFMIGAVHWKQRLNMGRRSDPPCGLI